MLPIFVFIALPTLSLALLLAIVCRRLGAALLHPNTHHKIARRRMMSRNEALRVLGLDDKANPQIIRSTYRRLMRKYHPDHGGSNHAAALLNVARDTLLGKRAKRAA